MRSKKFVVVYAIVLFLIVFLIAFNSVCSITQIDVKFDVSSGEAKEQAEKIQNELDGFLKKNYLFFDTERIEDIFKREENSHFRLLSVKKHFPNKISVEVCEKYEHYAFYDADSEKYYITDDSLEIITVKESATNNLSGNNIAVSGYTLTGVSVGEKLSVAKGQEKYFDGLTSLLSYFEKNVQDLRANIQSVEFFSQGAASFQMQEGVKLYFTDISKYSDALAEKVLNTYLGLEDNEKTYGVIYCAVTTGGDPNVFWSAKDL